MIIHGDCFEELNKFKDGIFDLCVTDPPYKFESMGGGFYAKNNSTQREYLNSIRDLKCCSFSPEQFLDTLKPKMKKFYGYFFCNKTLIVPYITWAKKNKMNYDVLVMAKSNPIPAYNNHHLSDLEYIIMIREVGTYFSKEKDLDIYRKFFMTSCKKGVHPAEKPVELLERFIKVSSKPNDIVVDPFAGSGATGVACENLNRKFVGIEITEKYVDYMKEILYNRYGG